MSCAVVIQTCDKYQKFWRGFFNFFNKHWDRTIDTPIYFCNENLDIDLPSNVNQIKTGTGTFVQNLKKTLSCVKEENIFFLLEDFWPIAPMTSKLFFNLYDHFYSNKLDSFQVGPYTPYYKLQKTNKEINQQRIFNFKKDSDWLFNFQARFWKKHILDECLIEPEISESKVSSAITVEIACDKMARNLRADFYHYFWYPIGGVAYRGELTEFGKQMQNIVEIDKLVKNLTN
jgi:hypothetical protein